jgi:hypothetical protein
VVLGIILALKLGDCIYVLAARYQLGTHSDTPSGFDLIAGQHPYLDAGVA